MNLQWACLQFVIVVVPDHTHYFVLSCKNLVSEFNHEMQQSLKRHQEEDTKNDYRNMSSTEYNKSKAISSLFLHSLKFNLIASVSG